MPRNTCLKLGSLNIQGNAKVKCETSDLQNLIRKHHIFAIQESWMEKGDACPHIPSYTPFRTERKKHPRANRNSGGIILYIKNTIRKGVTKVSARANSGGDAIWVKLEKNFFGINHNIFLCSGYLVPQADSDAFEIFRKEIEHFSNLGKVCLMGDLNSRTSTAQPTQYILDLDNDHDILTSITVPTRNNKDKVVNENGRQLLNLLSN